MEEFSHNPMQGTHNEEGLTQSGLVELDEGDLENVTGGAWYSKIFSAFKSSTTHRGAASRAVVDGTVSGGAQMATQVGVGAVL